MPPPFGDSTSGAPLTVGLILALIVALLTRLICPLPMAPTPVIVELLVKLPPLPFIKFVAPVPITSVPVPASVALPDPTLKKVPLPVEASVIVLLLVMVPATVVVVLLAIWRLPVIVKLLVKLPPLPFIKFVALLPITNVPVPVSVALPDATLKEVPLPVEASVIVPWLVIVPEMVVAVLLAIRRLPEFVSPLSALLLLTTAPVPAVVSVPPVMVVPLSVTVDPFCALMVPVLFQDAPLNSMLPPPVAVRVPLLM